MSRDPEGSHALVHLTPLARVPPGAAVARTVHGYAIALFNVGGTLHALDDPCLRCSASLAGATVAGSRLTCACGFGYDLATGAVRGVERLRTGRYDVSVVGDDICAALPSPARP